MAKYLDYDGLSYLWQKIDARIDSKINNSMDETVNLEVLHDAGGGVSLL